MKIKDCMILLNNGYIRLQHVFLFWLVHLVVEKQTSIKLIVEKIGLSYIYMKYKDFIKDFTFSRKSVLQQLNNNDRNQLIIIAVDGKMDEKLILEKAKKIKIIIISKSVVNIKKSTVYMFESPSRESMASILSWMY